MNRSSLHDLAHVKRFLELLEGDPGFRKEGRGGPSRRPAILEKAGIELSAADLQPFWDLLDAEGEAERTREEVLSELRRHPLGRSWDAWTRDLIERHRVAMSDWVPTGDERLTSWRRRRLYRARSESLLESALNVLPLFSFELSKGCSTQCWFCAWDPPKLQSIFPYTVENRRLWREILTTTWDLFGPGCKTAVCYHATEPTDNPDYFEFLQDVRELYGVHPHTTTARPLKNLAWTRELLRLQNVLPPSHDRFSVLTLASLREIHATFSAEELLNVNLALQNRGAFSHKVHSGRILEHEDRLESEARLVRDELHLPILRVGTIECTCGYLVNMVERTIQLISPCFASKHRPLGYIVHAEGVFRDAAEFRDVILRSIEDCMQQHLAEGDRLAFREDLSYQSRPDGFVLTSRYREHVARGSRHVASLGELVRGGTLTTGEITDRLVREGMPALEATSWLDRLHQGGLLADGEPLAEGSLNDPGGAALHA